MNHLWTSKRLLALALAVLVAGAVVPAASAVRASDIPQPNLVRYVKQELRAANFFSGPITNSHTSDMTRAIANFQGAFGLPRTGHLDAVGQWRLVALLKKGNPNAALPRPKSQIRAAWVRKVQQALRQVRDPDTGERFFPGRVTGVYGGGTIRAVAAFELCSGITADGFYGPETRSALIHVLVFDESLHCGLPT